jgi:hypothetical protein
VKVGDLVEHTVFEDQSPGIIVNMDPEPRGRWATCDVLWPGRDETHTESLFLLRLLSESR